jgi:uncharacterized integral membrane protein
VKAYLKRAHLIAGLVALAIFPLTGTYMRRYLADEFLASDRFRFSVRANHIYILLSALIQISFGSYLRVSEKPRWANLQTLATLLLLASTTLVITAFFLESKTGLERPLTLIVMVSALTGTLLHAFVALRENHLNRTNKH